MNTDTLYKDNTMGLFYWSPDGVGAFFYDTREEAQEAYGDIFHGITYKVHNA